MEIGNAYPQGKLEHREAACPSLAAHLPFLAARSSKEVIIKHLFAKSQPINPRATTPSLTPLSPWVAGGRRAVGLTSRQVHGRRASFQSFLGRAQAYKVEYSPRLPLTSAVLKP